MQPKIIIERDPEAQAKKTLHLFQSECESALAKQSTFSVALSSGETPKRFYELLPTVKLPWEKIHFFWGDERCVPPDNPKSNYKMATDLFFSKISIPEENIHRMNGELDPEKAAELYEEVLRSFFGEKPQFDFNLLGLGTNGHTASLFPHTEVLKEKKRWVVGYYVDEVKMSRLTLTAPAINESQFILFLVSGKEKAGVVDEVINGARDPERLPAQLIQPESGRVTWLLDKPAALALEK